VESAPRGSAGALSPIDIMNINGGQVASLSAHLTEPQCLIVIAIFVSVGILGHIPILFPEVEKRILHSANESHDGEEI